MEREYEAVVEGDPLSRFEDLKQSLAAGIETSDGVFPANLLEATSTTVRLVVCEGKYRMVRRILANAGHPVTGLHRLRYGKVVLADIVHPGELPGAGESLPAGLFCEVGEAALEWARAEVLR